MKITSDNAKPGKSKKKLVILIGIILLVGIGMAGGCCSSTLPPRITKAQRATLHGNHIGMTVGVEDYKFPVYSDKLTEVLRQTGMFAGVDHLKNFSSPPDLIARVEKPISGTAVIPIATALSLGIVPTNVNESHGIVCSFHAASGDNGGVPISYIHSGKTTLGWWAMILNLLPDQTMRSVKDHPRFIEGFGWEIASRADDIEALKKRE